MYLHLRKQVDYYDTSHYQGQSDIGWHVRHLLEYEDTGEGDEHYAKGTPDSIGNTYGHHVLLLLRCK